MKQGNREHGLERAAEHRGLVVVESPCGFEADRFVAEILARVESHEELLDPAAGVEPVAAVAVLRAPLRSGLRTWQEPVLERYDRGQTVVVVLPAGISADALIDEPLPTVVIDAAALRETTPDISRRLATECPPLAAVPGAADLIAQLGDGWPTWVSACCSAINDQQMAAEELMATMGLPPFQRMVVERHFRTLDRVDCDRLAQLAHFERFSDRAAEALGGTEFAELALPHAPGLYRSPGGQLRFVQPVRTVLTAAAPLDSIAAQVLAPVLVADGDLLGACHALLDGGLDREAAELIIGLPGRVLDMGDQRELLGVLRVLTERVGDGPALSLIQARVHANLAEIAASVDACQSAIRSCSESDPIWLEASVELLLCRHRSISQEEAADALADLWSRVGEHGPLATRLREVEAQILGQADDVHVVQAAADRFVEVATEWEYQQESLRAAKALRILAAGPLWHLGHYREAQQRLDKAAKLAITQPFDHGVTLTYKAFFDARCGDWEAFRQSHEQARFFVAHSGIRWLGAYLHLAAAYEAAARRSAQDVSAELRAAHEALGPLWETDTGLVFGAEGAVLLAQTGRFDDAMRQIELLRGRRGQNEVEFSVAEVVVLARAGRRAQAHERWAELDRLDIVPNDRRWRIDLELALADGDAEAGLLADIDRCRIESDLNRLGLIESLPLVAPHLFDGGECPGRIRIEVLGGFRLLRNNVEIPVTEGRAFDLIKLLATNGGQATLDAVVDHLWPDADPQLGIRRLKNVLVKTRDLLGADAVLRTSSTVAFAEHVSIDLDDFEADSALADASRTVDPPRSQAAAVSALETYRGPLLPGDDYSDRITERRHELRRKADRLLGVLETEHRPSPAWVAAALQRVNAG